MPYYVVTDNSDSKNPKQHLVSAKTQAAALKAIVEPRFSVVAADQDDCIKLTKDGVEVVTA